MPVNPGQRNPPPLLYIYFRAGVPEFLADPHLRFSNPTTFNDPFEFRPDVRLRGSREQIVATMSQYGIPRETPASEAEIQLARRIHENGVKRYHVLCFTEDPLNQVMWGLYGDRHKGCVLGFDSDLFAPWIELNLTAGPVVYTDTRPVLDIPTQNELEANMRVIFSKGTAWSSEREWRIAVFHPETAAARLLRPFNFDPKLLRMVICGARCGREFAAVRNALDDREQFKHVELLKAQVDPHLYSLNLVRRNGASFNLRRFLDAFERNRQARRERGNVWYAEAMRRREARKATGQTNHQD